MSTRNTAPSKCGDKVPLPPSLLTRLKGGRGRPDRAARADAAIRTITVTVPVHSGPERWRVGRPGFLMHVGLELEP